MKLRLDYPAMLEALQACTYSYHTRDVNIVRAIRGGFTHIRRKRSKKSAIKNKWRYYNKNTSDVEFLTLKTNRYSRYNSIYLSHNSFYEYIVPRLGELNIDQYNNLSTSAKKFYIKSYGFNLSGIKSYVCNIAENWIVCKVTPRWITKEAVPNTNAQTEYYQIDKRVDFLINRGNVPDNFRYDHPSSKYYCTMKNRSLRHKWKYSLSKLAKGEIEDDLFHKMLFSRQWI